MKAIKCHDEGSSQPFAFSPEVPTVRNALAL